MPPVANTAGHAPVRPAVAAAVAQVLLMIPALGSFGPAGSAIFVAIIVVIVVGLHRRRDRWPDRSLTKIGTTMPIDKDQLSRSSPVGWPCACPIKQPIANSFPSTRLLKTKPGVAHKPVSLTSFGFTTRYAGDTEARRHGAGVAFPCPPPEDCCADLPRGAAMSDGFIPDYLAAPRGKSAQHSKRSDGRA